ncbi:MAG: MBL fold metallo-hydrolase [Abitibacteriaceae bacterium]|nr:MBL fold metallo-hydrolase [Abditibacteriaceae bacterium]MBV9864915.1 MBL fold metallo-hydrolase [Abditibacteriaceae bacterium]
MQELAPHVAYLPIIFVNVYFVGEADSWILIDSGLGGKADQIRSAAEEHYGAGARPKAIYLTHGHQDHAGSALELAEGWDVPIYAHPLELPYLTGKSSYPPPDPTLGGFIAFGSRFMSAAPFNFGSRVRELTPDGEVPEMPDWKWYFTPGHSPGHVSYFRASDNTLVAGDAVATMNMDSWVGAMTKKQEIARAGAPFNCDWGATRESVQQLAQLRPKVIGAGHGIPMTEPNLAEQLETFAANFPMPSHGRYAHEAAHTDENGIVSLPPPAPDPLPKIAAAVGVAALGSALVLKGRQKELTPE